MADKMFTRMVKDSSPLDGLLRERARPAYDNVEVVAPHHFEAASDDELVARLEAAMALPEPTVAIGRMLPSPEPARTERRSRDRGDPEDRSCVWRWRVQFEVTGNVEVLTRWPALLTDDPCGDDLQLLPTPWVYWQAEGGNAIAYIDVPCDEDDEGSTPPKERILAAGEYLRRAADAANEEVAAFQSTLRAHLRTALATRRHRLGAIQRGNEALIELARERFGDIELEEAVEIAAAPVAPAGGGLAIALNHVVAGSSFEAVLEVTRKWGRGAERYPDAFGPLEEEAITSLLVTTLNVVFDAAHREVFHVNGKTDIFVQVDVGKPDEGAHLGEAKIWNGKAQVAPHSDKPGDVAQLLGYTNARTQKVMLLYYVRKKNLDLAIGRCFEAVEGCAGFVRFEGGEHRVAVFQHPSFGHEVNISLEFVHLPTAQADDDDA